MSVILGYLSVFGRDNQEKWRTRAGECYWRPVLVDVGHRHQAAIEHFGNPDD
jgi:hypothetical protein